MVASSLEVVSLVFMPVQRTPFYCVFFVFFALVQPLGHFEKTLFPYRVPAVLPDTSVYPVARDAPALSSYMSELVGFAGPIIFFFSLSSALPTPFFFGLYRVFLGGGGGGVTVFFFGFLFGVNHSPPAFCPPHVSLLALAAQC